VADDQVRQGEAGRGHRVIGRRRQREQDALVPEFGRDRRGACPRHDQAGGGAAEEPAHRAEAGGARNEHRLADPAARERADRRDAPDRLVARHQRVAHAGECRHATGPEQALGAAADAAPLDIDHHVRLPWRGQFEAAEDEVLGVLQHHGDGVHSDFSRPAGAGLMVTGHERLSL
jgi:hypothetical protein